MGVIKNADSLSVLTEPSSTFNKISPVIETYIKFEERCSTEAGGKEEDGWDAVGWQFKIQKMKEMWWGGYYCMSVFCAWWFLFYILISQNYKVKVLWEVATGK